MATLKEEPITGGAPEGGGSPLRGGAPGGGDVKTLPDGSIAEVPITGGAPEGGGSPLSGGAPEGGGSPLRGGAPEGGGSPLRGGAPEGGGSPLRGGAPGGGDVKTLPDGSIAEVPITGGAPEGGGAPTGVAEATSVKTVGESQAGYRVSVGQKSSSAEKKSVGQKSSSAEKKSVGSSSVVSASSASPAVANAAPIEKRRKIKSVSQGPRGLVYALNEIIAVLNGMKLTPGAGISIEETGVGWIVSKDKS